jgi:hypothetical protein
MAAGPEANLWKSMQRNLPEGCSATRLENRHGGGVPDLLLMWNGLFYLVELKAPKSQLKQELISPADVSSQETEPRVYKSAEIMRPEQRAYHARAAARGCPSFILARPQKSNEISLLTPVITKDALRLEEICTSKHWFAVFSALRLHTEARMREALRLSDVS